MIQFWLKNKTFKTALGIWVIVRVLKNDEMLTKNKKCSLKNDKSETPLKCARIF